MKEVNEDLVAKFLAQINHNTLPDISVILDKVDDDMQKIAPIALDLFINKLQLKNPLRFLEDTFKTKDISRIALSYFKKNLPKTTKSIDVGCGWGSLTKLLCEEYEEVFAIDWVLEHAIATKVRSPKARVFHGDARNMHILESAYFDVVFATSLIEHVGDPVEPTGKSGKNFYHQYNLVRELSRITKPNGTIFITTGNYNFPRDVEDNLWFYHWLPAKEKIDYCAHENISTDNYWLLSWTELDYIISACGLTIESVISPDTDVWDNLFIDHLDKAFQGLDHYMIDLWRNLIKNNPNYFDSWIITTRKNGMDHNMLNMKNKRCNYHRTLYFNESCDCYCRIVAEIQSRLSEIQSRLSEMQSTLSEMQSTLSWRLTKPLRWCGNYLIFIRRRILKLILDLPSQGYLKRIVAKLPEPVIRLAKIIFGDRSIDTNE